MALFTTQPLFSLGFILVAGYFAGRAANFLRLPRISGYIISGLALSPSVSGLVAAAQLDALFNFTSDLALSFIAYSVGGSLLFSRVRELGKVILTINLAEGIGAFICTCFAVYAAQTVLPPSITANGQTFLAVTLILGGIAVATAPAATMAVVHELRARGPLTTTLLGVVALDDGLSILIFTGALTAAAQLQSTAFDHALVWQGLLTLTGAIGVGMAGGFIFCNFLDPTKRPETNFMLCLGGIFLVSGLAKRFDFSPLLANMVMGFVIMNRIRQADDLFHQLDIIEEAIYCLFFTLAAAHFDAKVFISSALLGIVLLVSRFVGKFCGTLLGGKISQAAPQIYKNLGFTLLPQAGLSLGLIFLSQPILPAEVFDLVLSAVLASIILNEIISPPLVKWSINRAGESNPER